MPISIHALREEGDTQLTLLEQTTGIISIHALREEGDQSCASGTAYAKNDFYPRPPRGGRPMTTVLKINDEPFLSTPSARRATMEQIRRRINNGISIHALREEGDPQLRQGQLCRKEFLSTPSARRATLPGGDQIWPGEISIHALREEGDDYFAPSSGLQGHFYPRPPRGGRQQKQRQNLYFLINYTTFCTNLEEP